MLKPYLPRLHGLLPSTPALFLDFDGVTHPYDPWSIEVNLRVRADLGPFCWLHLLTQTLGDYPAVRIVVTSDWRYFSDGDKMRGYLGPLASRFAGSTGLAPGFTRADYIAQVVRLEALRYWCALDDDPSVFRASQEEPRFVACDPAKGLCDPLVTGALTQWLQQLPR